MNAITAALAKDLLLLVERCQESKLSDGATILQIGVAIEKAYYPQNPEKPENPPQNPISFGEWQLCPKCSGHKKIINPKFGQQDYTAVEHRAIDCDICGGAGIIAKPIIKP